MEDKIKCLLYAATVQYAYEKKFKLGGDLATIKKDIARLRAYLYQVQNSSCGENCFSTKFLEQLENLYICKPTVCEEDKLDCEITITFPPPQECVDLILTRIV